MQVISGHVWIGISNEMPDENMARLVYPIRCQMKGLPAINCQTRQKYSLNIGILVNFLNILLEYRYTCYHIFNTLLEYRYTCYQNFNILLEYRCTCHYIFNILLECQYTCHYIFLLLFKYQHTSYCICDALV